MKIYGTDGMSSEDIRDEINRGGRLIVYMYCVSVLVMTFKRSAGIRLIRSGHSPVAAGLPYTLISLFCGWWGFPWGPIYTIETIYRNLSGGIDVTDEVMRALLPANSAGAPPKVPPLPTLRVEPVTPQRGFNTSVALLMAGGAAALIFGGISLYCYNETQNLTVVLVSGLDHPSQVTLNGVEYRLGIHGSKILKLPEGNFVLGDGKGNTLVGSPQTLSFTTPFFDHLSEDHVAVINPDRTAVLLNEQVIYYSDGTTPPANEDTPYTVYANQYSYFLSKTDYVLETPPPRSPIPSGTNRLVKTQLEMLTKVQLPAQLRLINEKLGYAAAREHLMLQSRLRADESLLFSAVQTLKPEDQRAFFLSRLGERPVLVDWHRYYQGLADSMESNVDLEKEYRGFLQADPTNGALLYLLGRITTDRTASRKLYLQALAAPTPCPHAFGALGFDAMCNGQFSEALEHFRAAEKAGLSSQSRSRYRRQSYWGLHQFETVLAEVRTDRTAEPMELELAADEIRATLAIKPDASSAEKIKSGYLTGLRKAKSDKKTIAESDDYLSSVIAYQTGRLPEYAELVSHFDYPYYKFSAALTKEELEDASKAALAKPKPQTSDQLLLYLLAKRKGDETAAEKHFSKAIELMSQESKGLKQAASLLAAAQPTAPENICDLAINPDDKCVLLTALGVRDPAHQSVYHTMAAKLDYLPDFPHQFLRKFLVPSTP